RFYDPTAGRILLDGVDLRDYKLADLRRQFAVVLQETVLFSASIAENIAYAAPGATRQQIVAAAHAANAHEFVVRLPRGYDTQVGERGAQLSGGQRQRIALPPRRARGRPQPTGARQSRAIPQCARGVSSTRTPSRPRLRRCGRAVGRAPCTASSAPVEAGRRSSPNAAGRRWRRSSARCTKASSPA